MRNPLSALGAYIFKNEIERQSEQKAGEFISVATKVLKQKVSALYRGGSRGGQGDGSKFRKGLSASGRSITFRHATLRQNARDAMQDSPQAKMVVDRFADTVVDTGLKVKPSPKYKILGITAEKAEEWSEDVAEKFDSWASSKKSDRSERNTFYQNQRLYHIFQQRDNDQFVRFFYNSSKKLVNPLQIKFIDPNQIRGYAYTSSRSYYNYDDGIIRDAGEREIGYKIWEYKNGEYKEHQIPAKGPRSGRTMMIHGYNPEYANQGRGYTRLSHILQEIENLTDFTVSHIMKAIQQTVFSMWVKPSADNPASNPIESRAGPREENTYGTTEQDTEVSTEDDDPIVKYSGIPEATFDVPGSVGVFNLQEGEELKPFDHSAPVDKYDSFVDAFFKHLSASMSMPAEVALMRFEQNYSASRGALTLFWRVAQIWRKEMKADFLDPVYESWLSEEIAAGRVQAPGWSDPVMRQAWLSSWWAGAPMPNIDPMKTMKADMGYVEMGAQTLDDVAENFNGSSGKSNRAKITREFQELPESPFNQKSQAPTNNQATAKITESEIDKIVDEIMMRMEENG